MAILPIRCGNSNRADLQQISASLLQQRGDAITTAPGSVIWTEVQAHARAIYHIWAYNQKMGYQFDPNKMSDFITRWATILSVSLLPNDTLQAQQERMAARFSIINKFPTTQAVTDLLRGALQQTFLALINGNADTSYVQFPGGVQIDGGDNVVGDGLWLSSIQQIFVEVTHPPYFTNNQFYNTVNQIYGLLNAYLPAYTTFDWFWDSFSDDGYAGGPGDRATISTTVGSTTLTGVGTSWFTPINFSPTYIYNVFGSAQARASHESGYSILECYDDDGNWQQLAVEQVNSDTNLTLINPAVSNITNKTYVIQGFFCDCDPTQFPYPPAGCLNLDNAGLNLQ